MQLTKVRLKNFGLYRDSTYELSQGLIGIVGPNGSGKSTLVNGIYACLTNDFSRFAGRKTGIICDTADDRDRSLIEVCGEHNGVSFKLTRNLRPNSAKLVLGDMSYTKATDIEKYLIKDLGLNRKLIDAYVFVNQWSMFSFLSQTDGKRAEVFQSLCGTEKSTDIYDACTKFISTEGSTVSVVDNRDEIEANLSLLRSELISLQTRREEHSRYLLSDKNRSGAEKIVSTYVVWTLRQRELKAAQKTDKQLSQDRQRMRTELSNAKRQSEKLEGFSVKAFEAMAELREGKLLQEQALKNKQKRDAFRLKLSSYEKIKPVYELPDKKICPTCSQVVTDKELEDIHIKEFQTNFDAYKKAVTDIKNDINDIEVNEEHLKFNNDIWENALLSHTDTKRAFKISCEDVTAIEKSVSQVAGEIRANSERISSLNNALRGSSVAEYNDIYRRAKTRLAEHETNKTKVDSLDGAIEVKEEAISYNERLLISLEDRLKKHARHAGLLEVITEARDIFHWQKLPRQVAQANLAAITGEINAALENFGNPFWVEADVNLSFKVHFPGTPTRPAGALSGGQKVVLAICFRSAVNRLFGNNIGMMFLDEPTAGLDDENIGYFRDVLTQMANKIRDKYQLFVITHEEALSPSFDTTLSVGV